MFNGLMTYAEAPAFNACTALSSDAWPVTISTAMSGCISFKGVSSSIPSTPGSLMSRRAALKNRSRAFSIASCPVPAVSVSYPCFSSMSFKVLQVLSSSSTTRMRSLSSISSCLSGNEGAGLPLTSAIPVLRSRRTKQTVLVAFCPSYRVF